MGQIPRSTERISSNNMQLIKILKYEQNSINTQITATMLTSSVSKNLNQV